MCKQLRMTKRDERREMLRLMLERLGQTPGESSPAWLRRFWLSRQRRLT